MAVVAIALVGFGMILGFMSKNQNDDNEFDGRETRLLDTFERLGGDDDVKRL